MTPSTDRLIVGNWKMNGDVALVDALASSLAADDRSGGVVVCPPATLLHYAHQRLAPCGVEIGGQDCHSLGGGAYTGDLSADLLAKAQARWVIVGHSERRRAYGESDALVHQKALAAMAAGLKPIVCVGDTLEERDAGRAVQVVIEQVRAVCDERLGSAWALAYEPVWAIGSGRAASLEDIRQMHEAIRAVLEAESRRQVPILYGGSVTPDNARVILATPEVSGEPS